MATPPSRISSVFPPLGYGLEKEGQDPLPALHFQCIGCGVLQRQTWHQSLQESRGFGESAQTTLAHREPRKCRHLGDFPQNLIGYGQKNWGLCTQGLRVVPVPHCNPLNRPCVFARFLMGTACQGVHPQGRSPELIWRHSCSELMVRDTHFPCVSQVVVAVTPAHSSRSAFMFRLKALQTYLISTPGSWSVDTLFRQTCRVRSQVSYCWSGFQLKEFAPRVSSFLYPTNG